MVKPNRQDYFRSLAEELLSQAKRVRDLIGDRHWLSDGSHKEYLLTALLTRHLPSGLSLARGFVTDPWKSDLCSQEQDILIYDTSVQGPLFNQGGTIIALPNTVVATISVKSTMSRQSIIQTIENQNSVRSTLNRSGTNGFAIWCAGYFFEADDSIKADPDSVYAHFFKGARDNQTAPYSLGSDQEVLGSPNVLCCGRDLIYKAQAGGPDKDAKGHINTLRGYQCDGLATAAFIALLLEHIAQYRYAEGYGFSDLVDGEGFAAITTPSRAEVIPG